MSPTMNKESDFKQEPVLLPDYYPATLHKTEEYERDYGQGPVQKVAWIFAIKATADDIDDEIEYEGDVPEVFEAAAHTSLATGPKSNFAKLGFSEFVPDDWDGNSDYLVGKEYQVDVGRYTASDGIVKMVVEKVRPPKKGRKGGRTAQQVEAEQQEEEDFNQLPV